MILRPPDAGPEREVVLVCSACSTCSPRAASKSCDHGWVVRRHAETGVFASGLIDIAGGWVGCDGCGGAADLRR